MGQIVHETCFVLRRRSYRETSLLMELLTSESQYVHAIYRGAKRKGAEAMDLLAEYLVSWREQVDLRTIRSCELLRNFDVTGQALYAVLYLNELIRHGVHQNQSVPGIFNAYQRAVMDLQKTPTNLELILRQFEKSYLALLGYGVSFSREHVDGEEIQADASYLFDPQHGFLRVRDSISNSYDGRTLLAIEDNDYEQSMTRAVAKNILRQAIRFHVGAQSLKASELLTASQYRDSDQVGVGHG